MFWLGLVLGFILGFVIGAYFGIILMAILSINKIRICDSDLKLSEDGNRDEKQPKED